MSTLMENKIAMHRVCYNLIKIKHTGNMSGLQ